MPAKEFDQSPEINRRTALRLLSLGAASSLLVACGVENSSISPSPQSAPAIATAKSGSEGYELTRIDSGKLTDPGLPNPTDILNLEHDPHYEMGSLLLEVGSKDSRRMHLISEQLNLQPGFLFNTYKEKGAYAINGQTLHWWPVIHLDEGEKDRVYVALGDMSESDAELSKKFRIYETTWSNGVLSAEFKGTRPVPNPENLPYRLIPPP